MGHGQTGWKGWVVGYGVQGRGGGWTVPGGTPAHRSHQHNIRGFQEGPGSSLWKGMSRAPGVLTGKEPRPAVDRRAVSRPRMQSADVRRT